MKIIFLLVYYELKKYRRELLTILLVALSPPLFLILMAGVSGVLEEERGLGMPFPVGVVNLDGRPEAEAVVFFLMDNEELKELFDFTLFEKESEREEIPQSALSELKADALAAIVIIPEGFSTTVARGGSMDLQFMGNYRRPLAVAYTEAMLRSGTKLVTAAQSGVNTVHYFLAEAGVPRNLLGETVRTSYLSFFLHAMARKEVLTTETVSPWGPVTPVEYYSVSLIILFLMLGGMTLLKSGRGGEREGGGRFASDNNSADNRGSLSDISAAEDSSGRGISQRLKSCGISSSHLTAASFISALIFLALQAAIIFALFAYFMEGFFRGDTVSIALITFSLIAVIAALLVFIPAFTGGAAANIVWFFLILFMALAGGGIIPMTLLPSWIYPLQYLSIFKWAGDGLYQGLFAIDGGAAVITGAAVMLSAAVLLTGFAALKGRH